MKINYKLVNSLTYHELGFPEEPGTLVELGTHKWASTSWHTLKTRVNLEEKRRRQDEEDFKI
jgi:hypothetical protein